MENLSVLLVQMAGKSTLLKAMRVNNFHSQGEVLFYNQPIEKLKR